MNVKIVADTKAYLEGMDSARRAIEKQKRRERRRDIAWLIGGVIGAIFLVGYIAVSLVRGVSGAW